MKSKRKNGAFPRWMIIVIVAVVVIVAIALLQPTSTNPSTLSSGQQVDPTLDPVIASPTVDLTGTYVIDLATSIAQGTPPPAAEPPTDR